jgi:hypothetical protein
MDEHRHEWDLLMQAEPETLNPFGFVCECGQVTVERFSTVREAQRAARAHAAGLADRPAA